MKQKLIPALLIAVIVVLFVALFFNYSKTKSSKEEIMIEVTEISKELSQKDSTIVVMEKGIVVIGQDNEKLQKRLAAVERKQKKAQQIIDSLITKPTSTVASKSNTRSRSARTRSPRPPRPPRPARTGR